MKNRDQHTQKKKKVDACACTTIKRLTNGHRNVTKEFVNMNTTRVCGHAHIYAQAPTMGAEKKKRSNAKDTRKKGKDDTLGDRSRLGEETTCTL